MGRDTYGTMARHCLPYFFEGFKHWKNETDSNVQSKMVRVRLISSGEGDHQGKAVLLVDAKSHAKVNFTEYLITSHRRLNVKRIYFLRLCPIFFCNLEIGNSLSHFEMPRVEEDLLYHTSGFYLKSQILKNTTF